MTNTDDPLHDHQQCLFVAYSGEVLGISTCQPSFQVLNSSAAVCRSGSAPFQIDNYFHPGVYFWAPLPLCAPLNTRLFRLGLSAFRLPSCSIGVGAIHLDVGKYPPAFYPDPLHFDPCSPRPIPKDRCWKRPPDKRPALRPLVPSFSLLSPAGLSHCNTCGRRRFCISAST